MPEKVDLSHIVDSAKPLFTEFREAPEKTLEQRKEGQGIGGYISVYPNEPGNNYWPQNPGILKGASGIGLALLAATSNVAPLWDRMLMLDLPPQSF